MHKFKECLVTVMTSTYTEYKSMEGLLVMRPVNNMHKTM